MNLCNTLMARCPYSFLNRAVSGNKYKKPRDKSSSAQYTSAPPGSCHHLCYRLSKYRPRFVIDRPLRAKASCLYWVHAFKGQSHFPCFTTSWPEVDERPVLL